MSAVQPVIADAFAGGPPPAAIRVDGEKPFIDDEATTAGSGYVSPSVRLEFGVRDAADTNVCLVLIFIPGRLVAVDKR